MLEKQFSICRSVPETYEGGVGDLRRVIADVQETVSGRGNSELLQ
jgi:hypothetical protein